MLRRAWVDIDNLGGYAAASQLLHKHCCTLKSIYLDVGVYAALEAERCVGVKAEALSGLTHPYGVEVGALDKYVYRLVADARLLTTVNARDTHRSLCRADHKVVGRERALYVV